MIKVFCNACKQEMTNDQIANSNTVAAEWVTKMGDSYMLTVKTDSSVDCFCPVHLPFAEDYWLSKVDVMSKLSKQASSTIHNHCKDFYKKLNDSTGIHRENREITTRSSNQGTTANIG